MGWVGFDPGRIAPRGLEETGHGRIHGVTLMPGHLSRCSDASAAPKPDSTHDASRVKPAEAPDQIASPTDTCNRLLWLILN